MKISMMPLPLALEDNAVQEGVSEPIVCHSQDGSDDDPDDVASAPEDDASCIPEFVQEDVSEPMVPLSIHDLDDVPLAPEDDAFCIPETV
jgi:hypothetical protein